VTAAGGPSDAGGGGRPRTLDVERVRRLLLDEQAAAEARIQEREALIPDTVRQPEDLVDSADVAVMVERREQALIENAYDRDLVERIERALQRIEEGTYGISEVSGQPIPQERLEAVPWATTLVDEEPEPD
jgi:RNA polymerase-binding transcription factor DksA